MHVSRLRRISLCFAGVALVVGSSIPQGLANVTTLNQAPFLYNSVKEIPPSDVVARKTPKHHCENIHESTDMCKHARKYCSPQSAGMIDYIAWYYCDMKDAQPLAFSLLIVWTSLLFSTIGIASSDFFCPNLATIASSLGLSQSVAGVTFLAFGNGSPDVFSTFAAFKAHSGSLAIGELLGAAAFITSVVAGSMAIIAPFKVSRRSFLRDAGFFLVAVVLTMVLLADGSLHLWESILMIVFYVIYVAYVLIGTYINRTGTKKSIIESRIRSHFGPSESLTPAANDDDMDDVNRRLLQEGQQDLSALEVGGSDSDDETGAGEHDYHDLNSSMSVTGRPTHTLTNTFRPSLLGALEFRELVTGFADDGNISPEAFKSMKRRGRSHSAACHSPVMVNKERDRRPVKDLPRPLHANSSDRVPQRESHHRSQSFKGTSRHLNNDVQISGQPAPVSISRSSSASGNGLANDEIASASLRKHYPIELLSPANSTLMTSSVPAIQVEGPADESDPFAQSCAEYQNSEYANIAKTYETMEDWVPRSVRPDRPTIVIPGRLPELYTESENEEDRPNEINCKCAPTWCPAWWPQKVLPAPQQLRNLLFPTLEDFRSLSYTQRLLSILAVPSVLVLTVTLPVVNPPLNQKAAEEVQAANDIEAVIAKDDADRYTAHRGWNRWLTCVQCLLAPLFISTVVLEGEYPLLYSAGVSIVIGLVLVAIVMTFTSTEERPRSHTWFCFIGFAVSVCWISTIANEVVGTLQAFGTILGLSDAILGLTVFAVGNSLGDFVADVTVARMGFSQMAISGVFGGPMLNILLGIGLSGVYITTSRHQVYNAEISTTLIASGASLLVTLIVLLIAVPANDYIMSRKLGFVLCGIFLTGMIISVLVEIFT